MREECGACGLDLSPLNAEDGAAFFIIVAVSAVIIPLAVWVEVAVAPPIWVHLLVWLPVIVVATIAMMRPFKAWLVAQHYKHSISEYNQ